MSIDAGIRIGRAVMSDSKWISVEDRFPETPGNGWEASEYVLVAWLTDADEPVRFERACRTSTGLWARDGRILGATPSHWMPCPILGFKDDAEMATHISGVKMPDEEPNYYGSSDHYTGS